MINLKKCLSDREGFLVSGTHDELVDLVFSDESDEYAFIGARGFFDTGKNAISFLMVISCVAPSSLAKFCREPRSFWCSTYSHVKDSKSVDSRRLSLRSPWLPKRVSRARVGVSARFQSTDSVTITKHIFRLLRTTRTEGPQIVSQGLEPSSARLRKT